MRAGSNPGGDHQRWVKGHFIDAPPDPDRYFIPARAPDNPALDLPGYIRSLGQLDPQTRAQLLEGDWNVRPPGTWVFDHRDIEAARDLGARHDAMRERGAIEPEGGILHAGVDWGDLATHAIPLWPLERGGFYVPPGEVRTSREDPETIYTLVLAMMGAYDRWWWSQERYDSAFAQTNRGFVRVAEQALGMHNPMLRSGRPNTVPISFGEHKQEAISYIRLLLRGAQEWPHSTRALAISPRNPILLEQMFDYRYDEHGRIVKLDDDAVDALIAGVAPTAKRHRAMLDTEAQRAKVTA
jgi:hypothetical protein